MNYSAVPIPQANDKWSSCTIGHNTRETMAPVMKTSGGGMSESCAALFALMANLNYVKSIEMSSNIAVSCM